MTAGVSDQRKRLLDLQVNQAVKRQTLFRHTELDELRAIKFLLHRLFGNRGFLEANAEEPGIIYGGFYTDGPAPRVYHPGREKFCRRILRGATYAEILAQARLLGISGVGLRR